MLETGFAKMHLGIDDTGQDMQTGDVDDLLGLRRLKITNRGYPTMANPDIKHTDTVLIDDGTALKKQFEIVAHARACLCLQPRNCQPNTSSC